MRPLLTASAQAPVNAQGVATVLFSPHGESWEVNRLTVKVSTAVNEAVASYYLTTIGSMFLQESTMSGSSGDTSDIVLSMVDGDQLWVQWTGADVGAVATATLRGWRSEPAGGFRAR
jgi:hypothetical protein